MTAVKLKGQGSETFVLAQLAEVHKGQTPEQRQLSNMSRFYATVF